MKNTKSAILVVSFGTSYEETRKKTIDRIEEDIQKQYPQYACYRAWTSGMIRRKIEKRDGIHIPDIAEACAQMKNDGIAYVIVQPTHVINGIENERMVQELRNQEAQFERMVIGAPLLTSQEDNEAVVACIAKELCPSEDEALLLMGHGTEHYSNTVYAAIDYLFKDHGYENIFMGTVEAYPSFESLLKRVQALQTKKVVLAPFMIVAGDHARNDLSGADEDSWKSRLEQSGFSVTCILKGLGEYEGIRKLILAHTQDAVRRLNAEKE